MAKKMIMKLVYDKCNLFFKFWSDVLIDKITSETDHCRIFIFFTFAVLVPEFLMPYSPSCGGTGLSLNNLQGQTPAHVTVHPQRRRNTDHRLDQY